MKHKLFTLIVLAFLFSFSLKAQIEKVIVETYYISDTLDATDTTDSRSLEAGSKTYRIYVDLKAGYKLKKIYGSANHALKISSTENFYNNIDRPSAYFGYLINKSWFTGNPMLGLDSWLTLGLATKTHCGILKQEDTDGSLIGGSNNTGGTAGIVGGIIRNADANAGLPVTSADGLLPNTNTLGQWSDNGFRNIAGTGNDTTVFGTANSGKVFYSTNAFLQQNNGVAGATADSNKILVAQLTTKGEISFELNLQLLDSTGASVNCVATNYGAVTTGDTIVSSSLKYPPVCGCKDPHFLEYSTEYSCNNMDSCKTKIIFGCRDTAACNYNPNANFHIQYMCCYPGYCYNRDISLVCPGISNSNEFKVYPNPVQNILTLNISTSENKEVKYEVYDSFGTIIIQKNLGTVFGSYTEQVDLSSHPLGLYLVRVYFDSITQSQTFTKN